MQLFTRPLDQYSITTAGPLQTFTFFTIQNRSRLETPRYQNWSLGFERSLPRGIKLGVNLLRKRGSNGFTYVVAPSPDPLATIYNLANFRRDVYDSAEVEVRQVFGEQYEWSASYTRSRTLSNAVLDISVDQPLLISDNVGRMPWDTPNRFVSFGFFPTPWKKWAVAYLLEWRDGFPFPVQRDTGEVVGAVNSTGFPRGSG